MNYASQREQIYAPLRKQGIFSWDFLYGQEYALASTCRISPADCSELAYATERLGVIFAKTIAVVQRGSDSLLAELGLPANAFPAVRLTLMPEIPTLIGRFDFARTMNGWKMLEFNADTPGGIVEAYHVNGEVCRYYGSQDPNEKSKSDLQGAFVEAAASFAGKGYSINQIVFSALDWHAEDLGTVRYLQKESGLNAYFCPLADLRVYRDRLCALLDGEMVPIDLWYRLHPLGVLSEETDQDGYPTGAHVLDLMARRKVAVLNPPSALIAQTKALQALIWNLYEKKEFFSLPEREIITQYMLPTYLENRFAGKSPHVIKPALGREGGGITIFGPEGGLLQQSPEQAYRNQIMVFQQYVEMETVVVETLAGRRQGFAVWGSFLINGKASAVNIRVGGRITDDMAYFWPVIFADKKENERDGNGSAVD